MRRLLAAAAFVLLAAPSWAQIQCSQSAQSCGDGTSSSSGVASSQAAFSATELTTATTGTSEEILYTWTIPANTFRQTGGPVGLRIEAFASGAANTNTKRLRVRIGGIGGTLMCDRTTAVSGDLMQCVVECLVATSTSFACVTNQNIKAASFEATADATGITFTNALSVVVTGVTVTAATDMTLRAVSAQWKY